MKKSIFTPDRTTGEEFIIVDNEVIKDYARWIKADEVSEEAIRKGDAFAEEIEERFYSDFEKTPEMVAAGRADRIDNMAHVPTFLVHDGWVYMTYYSNYADHAEDPNNQTARLAYCPIDDPSQMTFIDVQSAGDIVDGQYVNRVYDTMFLQKDEDTLYIMWTARIEARYYRFYQPFTMSTKTLGEIGVNRFRVGDFVNDFSSTGMRNAFKSNRGLMKTMYFDTDIGIMQKLTSRVEDGETWYYTGTYHGEFTCIIKSRDLITWEYVSQPHFPNDSQWENATYLVGDRVYYFVRQRVRSGAGFLTFYDLKTRRWAKPVLIDDCQSRSDFIMYKGNLYLIHAPIDREHIGIVKIDLDDIAKSEVILQAHMKTSCFYPFVNYFRDGELALAYTVNREHIRLAEFDLSKYL